MATALSTERLTDTLWQTTAGVLPLNGYRVGLVPLGWYSDAPRQSIAGNVFSPFNQGASASGGAGAANSGGSGAIASASAAGATSSGGAGVVSSGGSGEIHSV